MLKQKDFWKNFKILISVLVICLTNVDIFYGNRFPLKDNSNNQNSDNQMKKQSTQSFIAKGLPSSGMNPVPANNRNHNTSKARHIRLRPINLLIVRSF